ncbi:MAG: exosortase A-associated hydrolase 1 [Janthinobacterium sp.]|jgi:exosortase A-associated hydrolase 1
MTVEQHALQFECQSCALLGILSLPVSPLPRGVLIVTGGPQYRAGSHRQFALLAEHLANLGIPVLRFDYRGMGDSEGEPRTFEHIADDLKAATDRFFETVPGLQELALWGLCDGATAAAFYACDDKRICALILLNPWIRTAHGIARTTLRHYYIERLVDPQFWRKLVSGRFKAGAALRSLHQLTQAAYATPVLAHGGPDPVCGSRPGPSPFVTTPQRLLDSLQRFHGRLLIILSGDDLTAHELLDLQRQSPAWRQLLAKSTVQQMTVAHANHTFSRRIWRDEVHRICAQWIASW